MFTGIAYAAQPAGPGGGLGAFMPKLAGRIKDVTGSYDMAFYVGGILLLVAVALAFITKKPQKRGA